MTHIIINELTIHVPGAVVKTFDGGMSKLRVTQEQAQHIYDQLGPVLDFFAQQGEPDVVAPIVGQLDVSKLKMGGIGIPVSDKKVAVSNSVEGVAQAQQDGEAK